MKSISLGFLMLTSAASEASVVCFNRIYTSTAPLKIELSLPEAVATFKDSICRLKKIAYNPKSPKYQGWIRVGTPKDNCAELGLALFGESAISKKPKRVYWISISKEVQADTKGLVQVGFENDADPGNGPEAKLNMMCFVEKNQRPSN